MNKSLFTSIVLGIDALTIGAFGTAAYESGRPIVGVIFLFTLVVLSGIAFGFVLNQKDKPTVEINKTDFTRIGVDIMKQTVKILEEEHANDNPCPDGLCILLKNGLSRVLHINYDCITQTQMNMAFPFFTYNNAKTYGGAVNSKQEYWWNRDEILPRINFLKIMISWQENLN